MTQEHSVLFFGMHESAFIYFFIEDFNRMFLTFSFFAVRKHLRLRKMKNIGKYKVLCCLKNPFSIVLQTLECLIALLYIPWFSNYRHCSKVPDCHGIRHIQSHHETYCIEYFKRMHLHHILRYIIRHVLSWFHKWSFFKKLSIIIFKQHRKLSFREFLPDKIKSYSNIQSNSSQSEGFMKRYHNTTFKQTNIKTSKLTYHSLTENPSTL